jgi:hypothetical protein
MTSLQDRTRRQVLAALAAARRIASPFPYFLLEQVLPDEVGAAIAALPVAAPDGDTLGRRETLNSARRFIDPDLAARSPAAGAVAGAFQDATLAAALAARTGARLGGSFLRIEYCQDRAGFWLEPHTDIGAKLFTLLIYLSRQPEAEDWGTDVLDAAGRLCLRVPGTFNTGLAFLPAADTWHGFAKRPIRGVRRSLIINYVLPAWRSRHELAFADQPVRRA